MELIQNWQNLLAEQQLTLREVLIWLAVSSLLLFLAVREISTWFLKTTQIRIELKRLRKDLAAVHHELAQLRQDLRPQEKQDTPLTFQLVKNEKAAPEEPLFPMSH